MGLCDIKFQMALTKGMRKVEDAMLFPSHSISGEEVGIEHFNPPKKAREREGRGRKESEQRWRVCVSVCERKGKAGRDSDKLTCREVRCDTPRERDAQSVLSGFLAITDSRWRLQAVVSTASRLANVSETSMFQV